MASLLKLKTDIKKLKAAIASKATSGAIKTKLRGKLTSLENELDKLQPNKRKPKTTGPKSESALVRLAKKRRTNQGLSTSKSDIERDAIRPAKPAGRRTSANGNRYYEYRDNRVDNRQPPKKYRKLADGGDLGSDYRKKLVDNIVKSASNKEVNGFELVKIAWRNEGTLLWRNSDRPNIEIYATPFYTPDNDINFEEFINEKVGRREDKVYKLTGDLDKDTETYYNYLESITKKYAKGKMADGGETSSKNFNTKYNVGRAKYVINYHDGKKTHKDGSPFYDIATFKNMKDFMAYKKKLNSEGYKEYKDGGIMADGGAVSTRELNKKIKSWYMKTYPTDDMGKDIRDEITFKSLWNMMHQGYDVYEVLDVYDSIVRERVFEKLSQILGVDYDVVYNKWLGYADGGMMADGGKTQGYDDKKDESLGMTRGKLSLKDFVGNRKQKEHARRDDARFEERGKMADGGMMNFDYELKIQPDYKYKNIANGWLEDNKKDSLKYKLAVLLLRGKKDPDEILDIKESARYARLLRSLEKAKGESKHEMEWRTENYTLNDAEKWTTESLRDIFYVHGERTKMDHGGYMAKGGKTKDQEVVRGYFEDEAYEYGKGGETNYTKKWRVFGITMQGKRFDKEITLGRMSDKNDVMNALNRMYDTQIREVTSIQEVMAKGGMMADGGSVAKGNYEMLLSQAKEVMHHAEELMQVAKPDMDIEAWVVAKAERATTDLSDITHYLDGLKMAMGGMVKHNAHKVNA